MDSLKVTIITPSYNQREYLEDCILSVVNQDYTNIEYIIIDGGSTDGSQELIHRYADYIDHWVSEPDRGQSHAINKGFRKATGQIVAWLNADDMYFPDAVSTAVERFQNQHELTLFYGDCVFVDKSGSFLRYFTEVEDFDFSRLCNFSDFIMQPTTFFSMKHLEEVGFLDETLEYTMDWDLWCRFASIGSVHYEQKLIAANRDYGETKTNTGGWRRLNEIRKMTNRYRTLRWPHALINYSAAEVNNKFASNTNMYLKFFGRLLSVGLSSLSPASIWHSRQHHGRTFLYGFIPHSYSMPSGRAVISIPNYKTGFQVRITMNPADAEITVFVNNRKLIDNSITFDSYHFSTERYIISFVIEGKNSDGMLTSTLVNYFNFEFFPITSTELSYEDMKVNKINAELKATADTNHQK
ncbi:MAG: glycosyltransferase [Saprospiraceae bacterium]|nr:glycosyltransferase [Saprospiraceae bacterium]